MDGPPLTVVGILTLVVVAGGIVTLGVVCDLDPSCHGDVDREHMLDASQGDSDAIVVVLEVQDGEVVRSDAMWRTPAAESQVAGGDDGDGNGSVARFLLSVRKGGVLVDDPLRFELPNASGVVHWDSRASAIPVDPGDEFTVSLLSGWDDPHVVHRTRVLVEG